MKNIKEILSGLEQSEGILNSFIESIPAEKYKERRKTDYWTIHEHVCHLSLVQPMLYKRLLIFRDSDFPTIEPYLPAEEEACLADIGLGKALDDFKEWRQKQLEVMRDFPHTLWEKRGSHPEYHLYTPYILARHILLHDHWHMYRMEELWLTKDEYLA